MVAAEGGGEAALDAWWSSRRRLGLCTWHACPHGPDDAPTTRRDGAFEQLTDAMERALAGCAALHEQMAKAIKEKVAAEEAQEDGEANESSVEEMKRKRPREA